MYRSSIASGIREAEILSGLKDRNGKEIRGLSPSPLFKHYRIVDQKIYGSFQRLQSTLRFCGIEPDMREDGMPYEEAEVIRVVKENRGKLENHTVVKHLLLASGFASLRDMELEFWRFRRDLLQLQASPHIPKDTDRIEQLRRKLDISSDIFQTLFIRRTEFWWSIFRRRAENELHISLPKLPEMDMPFISHVESE